MVELKVKVEQFEKFLDKFQMFLEIQSQVFIEVVMLGKDVLELFQYMQELIVKFLEYRKDFEVLYSFLKEIFSYGLLGDKVLVFEKINNLLRKFKEMEDII